MKREGEEGRGGNMCTLGICLFVGVCEGESTSKEGKTEDQKAVFFSQPRGREARSGQ